MSITLAVALAMLNTTTITVALMLPTLRRIERHLTGGR